MKIVTMLSLKGGTGRTTVACNLAAQLNQAGTSCWLVDTDHQNSLGLHFGMQVGERFGLSRVDFTEHDLEAYRRRTPSSVPHLPFGQCTTDEVLALVRRQAEEPTWISRRIHEVMPPDADIAIIDTPPTIADWTRHLIQNSDLTLVVLATDPAAYSTIPSTQALLAERAEYGRVAYLMNRMDARLQLSVDVAAAMQNLLGDELLPFSIPADEAVREALALQLTLQEHAPHSHVSLRFRELADWITHTLLQR